MTLKLAKNWRFWSIDINVNQFISVDPTAYYVCMKVEDIPPSLYTCTTLLDTDKDTTMSEMKSCISGILK